MADLYLWRKLAGASSPVSGSGGANWFPASPTIGSKISRASRVSLAAVRGDENDVENDVEELEMLLEVEFLTVFYLPHFQFLFEMGLRRNYSWNWVMMFLQAYFMQIDSTLNKLTTVCTFYLLFLLFYTRHTHYGKNCKAISSFLNCINLKHAVARVHWWHRGLH